MPGLWTGVQLFLYVVLSAGCILYSSWVLSPTGRNFAYPFMFHAAFKTSMCVAYVLGYALSAAWETRPVKHVRKTWHGKPLTPMPSVTSETESEAQASPTYFDRTLGRLDAGTLARLETMPSTNNNESAFASERNYTETWEDRELICVESAVSSESNAIFSTQQTCKSLLAIVIIGTLTNVLSIYIYSSPLDLATRQVIDSTSPVVTMAFDAWLVRSGLRTEASCSSQRHARGPCNLSVLAFARIRAGFVYMLVVGSIVGVYRPTHPPLVLAGLEFVTVVTSTALGFVRQEFLLKSNWSVGQYVSVITFLDIPIAYCICVYAYGLAAFDRAITTEAYVLALGVMPAVICLVALSTQLQAQTTMTLLSVLDSVAVVVIVVFDIAYVHADRSPSPWLLAGLAISILAMTGIAAIQLTLTSLAKLSPEQTSPNFELQTFLRAQSSDTSSSGAGDLLVCEHQPRG